MRTPILFLVPIFILISTSNFGQLTVKDQESRPNILLQVNDEGMAGSLTLQSIGSGRTGFKLYNNGGDLFWGNTKLNGGGGASLINDLGDAIYDGSSLFIGEGSGGTLDDGGNNNTAVGKNSLNSNTTGQLNTANGYYSLNSNTMGRYNTANGSVSLYSNTEGNYNTANGYYSLNSNTTGYGNTAIGSFSLQINKTGSENTAIGSNAGPRYDNYSNTTALGNGATPSASNTIAIGNTSVTSIKGQVAFSTFSDGRYKLNVREDVLGIDFIMGLRPITYNLDINAVAEKLKEDLTIDENGNRVELPVTEQIASARIKKSSIRNSGFIAQEVEKLANNLGFDFSGVDSPQNEESMYALRYAEFVVPLVKAMQEQQEMIEELRGRISQLEANKRN